MLLPLSLHSPAPPTSQPAGSRGRGELFARTLLLLSHRHARITLDFVLQEELQLLTSSSHRFISLQVVSVAAAPVASHRRQLLFAVFGSGVDASGFASSLMVRPGRAHRLLRWLQLLHVLSERDAGRWERNPRVSSRFAVAHDDVRGREHALRGQGAGKEGVCDEE